MLLAGFRRILCETLLVTENVLTVRGRRGRGLSAMLPVSLQRDRVRNTNISFVLSNLAI